MVTAATSETRTNALDVVPPSRKIYDQAEQRRGDDHPAELVPIEEGQSEKFGRLTVIDPGK
jgi:hypothetical protein